MHYMEKQLKPEVEKEIMEGFFEIKKKYEDAFSNPGDSGAKQTIEQTQVYVSHLCLHNFHPIFCKFELETVQTILQYSQIVYLNKGQTLFSSGFNDKSLYVILFGRIKLFDESTNAKIGKTLNLGWTVGEEILFKSDKQRTDICKAASESCVLGMEKSRLAEIK